MTITHLIIIVVSLHLISTHAPTAMFQSDYKEWTAIGMDTVNSEY